MERFNKRIKLKLSLLGLSIMAVQAGYAATLIDVSTQKASSFASMAAAPKAGLAIQEIKRTVSPNNTLHVRMQQTYAGYPILGTDSLLHVPHAGKSKADLKSLFKNADGTMNGQFYQAVDADLASASRHIFEKAQAVKAMQHGLDLFQQTAGTTPFISQKESQLVVYVDKDSKAHFAFRVSFFAEPRHNEILPQAPTYIMDAGSLQVYEAWNDARGATADSVASVTVSAGGFGGNTKTGQVSYDGLPGNPPSFLVTRDSATGSCTLINSMAKLKRNRNNNPDNLLLSYSCLAPDAAHNNVFWSGDLISANSGYSTANDAMANTQLVRKFFQDWYGLPVVVKDGVPSSTTLVISYPMSGAIYSNGVLSMGDGAAGLFYPFTTRDILAHEFSHAFTAQYAKFGYTGQPGAIGESFGDMTAKAVQFYVTGTNDWNYAADVMKKKTAALRYMDTPSKDCEGRQPGDFCSVDHVSKYKDSIPAQNGSGIFNRAFYLLSTSAGWNVKKAYDVMVLANMSYWTSTSTFVQGACGVTKAASDFGYDTSAIQQAFQQVGIDTSSC